MFYFWIDIVIYLFVLFFFLRVSRKEGTLVDGDVRRIWKEGGKGFEI